MDTDPAAAFQAGVDAYWLLKDLASNPYPADSADSYEWAYGWVNAREEEEYEYEQEDEDNEDYDWSNGLDDDEDDAA